jgi:hypothetical protein
MAPLKRDGLDARGCTMGVQAAYIPIGWHRMYNYVVWRFETSPPGFFKLNSAASCRVVIGTDSRAGF